MAWTPRQMLYLLLEMAKKLAHNTGDGSVGYNGQDGQNALPVYRFVFAVAKPSVTPYAE